MSVLHADPKPTQETMGRVSTIPPLRNGDRLTRVEFERRYNAMPGVNKAELIEGTVYMPSPVRHTQHGRPHSILGTWLGYYFAKTPGVDISDNATSRLDEDNEPQPDSLLFLPKHAGGLSHVDDAGYIIGPPDFVAEIAASSVSIDLHQKLNAYRRNGVREYLVWRVEDEAVDWFELREGNYVQRPVDEAGIVRSGVFLGLALNVTALLAGDLPTLFGLLDQSTSTPDHAAFVKTLAAPSS